MMTMASLDSLLGKERSVILVECDTSNPDVARAYGEHDGVHLEPLDLDEADGWIELVNVCEAHPGTPVLVNTAARNNVAVAKYARTLERSLDELGRRLIVLWIINRQRDSLELLKEFMEAVPRAEVHVVRNGCFGEARKFDLYNRSELRTLVEGRGGKSVTFPDLADRVADDLFTKRLSLTEAAKVLPLGSRAELARWRSDVRTMLSEIFS
jgi:hypothetical protein